MRLTVCYGYKRASQSTLFKNISNVGFDMTARKAARVELHRRCRRSMPANFIRDPFTLFSLVLQSDDNNNCCCSYLLP